MDIEVFRSDVTAFFGKVPEPPLYRRRDDPAKRACADLVEEGEALRERAQRLGEVGRPYQEALDDCLAALRLVAQGRVEPAAALWKRSLDKERAAGAAQRLWSRTDEKPPPVFSKETRTSRYDPRPEPLVQVKLACPYCHKPQDHSVSPPSAMHSFVCPACAQPFSAYFAEVRELELEEHGMRRWRHVFRLEEWGGMLARVEFDAVGREGMLAARHDLMAFLYGPPTVLRGVLNLDSSRVLWLPSPGPCFVATVAFGEASAEVACLRRYRDEVLLASVGGRRFVRWYYRAGPHIAGLVAHVPGLLGVTRVCLRLVTQILKRRS